MPPLIVIAAAIAALVVLVAAVKVHPFLAFILVSAAAAVAFGMPAADIAGAIRKGIGDVFGALAIVIVTGAMLGKLVVESGAAQRIADTLVAACGEKRMAWAMAVTGFIIGIPLFYGVGFVLLVPIIIAVVSRSRQPLLVVAMPALASMSVAHGLLPPHPAPTALVATFGASLGLTLLYGFAIAIPALVIAGPLFGRTLTGIRADPLPGLAATPRPDHELPGTLTSIATAVLPAVLLGITAVAGGVVPEGTSAAALVEVLARHLGVTDPDDDVHRLAFSITGLPMQMFITRDVIDAVRPQLMAMPKAIDLWASRLADFAEAMVAVELARRQSLVPVKKNKP